MGIQELFNLETIDSVNYDANFEKCVKNFQIKYNLNVDGVFGNKCWAVMKSLFDFLIFFIFNFNQILHKLKKKFCI